MFELESNTLASHSCSPPYQLCGSGEADLPLCAPGFSGYARPTDDKERDAGHERSLLHLKCALELQQLPFWW